MRSAKRLKRMPFWMPNFVRAHTTLDKSCAGSSFFWENHGYFMVISSGWWYTYPSEKYECQLGSLFPVYGKIIHSCSKPPTSHGYVIVIQWDFAGTWYFFAFDEDHMEIVRHLMGEVGLSIWVLLFFLLFFFVNVTQSNDWYVHHGSYGWLYAYKKFESSNLPIAGHRIVYLPHLLAEIQ